MLSNVRVAAIFQIFFRSRFDSSLFICFCCCYCWPFSWLLIGNHFRKWNVSSRYIKQTCVISQHRMSFEFSAESTKNQIVLMIFWTFAKPTDGFHFDTYRFNIRKPWLVLHTHWCGALIHALPDCNAHTHMPARELFSMPFIRNNQLGQLLS